MPVRMIPVSMEALALTKMGRLDVSVCQHMEVTSVRLVRLFFFFLLFCSGNHLDEVSQNIPLSSLMFSDVEQCEPGWDKFHGFCYRHFSQRLSWEVAEQHCRMQGAHLVSIMTPEEQSYINSKFKSPVCPK